MGFMNFFKVGINFDFNLIPLFKELNEKYEGKGKIIEVYGSDRAHASLAARPDFRLPDVSSEDIKRYVRELKELGIMFNYTMNSIFPYGSKKELLEHKQEVINFVKWLEDIGVYRITVANPIMLEIIRNEAKSNIKIEMSTIAHVDTVTQIKYYKDKYNVDKVCGNLLKNRDFDFLRAASDYCAKEGIIYEVMANEFCGVGGDNYATHCIYRDSCYICHASNKTLDDANSFNEYPMKLCSNSRNQSPANWLKLRWIRPEDLRFYNDIGIHHFKITGRTGSTRYIKQTIEAYMSEEFDGNLLNLWKPLESIKGASEFDTYYNIHNKSLDGFIKVWTSSSPKKCENEVCGETCHYCENFYERNVK